MAVLRCKMCGGDISITEQQSIGVCEYCGCSVTVPRYDTEYTLTQFNVANDYRIAGDFDKAESIYAGIIATDPTNAEAYWCGLLAKYGIEYVEDALTLERVPTCHRIIKTSILEDIDYKKTIECSVGGAKRIYEKEARKINELLKKVVEISETVEPYDIFISYKENDEFGARTIDSVLAQDLYNNLIKEGYKVFFSKISLEDKLGEEYEPYIYTALNTAKIMLLVGSKNEYMESPWVKNEWSRFLELAKKDSSKRLIPCYKDICPKDFPVELSMLQSQDLGKIGAMQDVLHGISKIVKTSAVSEEAEIIKTDSRLERAFQHIEDKDYYQARNLLEDVLSDNTKNAKAYIGLLLCDTCLRRESDLIKVRFDVDEYGFLYDKPLAYWGMNKNFLRALEVADEEYKEKLRAYELTARENYMRDTGLATEYEECVEAFHNPERLTSFEDLMYGFLEIIEKVGSWKEADRYFEACKKSAEEELNKFCVKCGSELREGKRFCAKCGTKIERREIEIYDPEKEFFG